MIKVRENTRTAGQVKGRPYGLVPVFVGRLRSRPRFVGRLRSEPTWLVSYRNLWSGVRVSASF